VRTRAQARQHIERGEVFATGVRVEKPAELVAPEALEVRAERQYVGRGAFKLRAALDAFGIDCRGAIAADVGASTGGFTEILLERGAARVYAIDVGHDQLAASLAADPRVISMEGVNARHPFALPEAVSLAVVDLSFISLRQTLPNVRPHVRGSIVALVKPQFEVGREGLDKRGVVRDTARRRAAVDALVEWTRSEGLGPRQLIESPLAGNKEGNLEYLLWLEPG